MKCILVPSRALVLVALRISRIFLYQSIRIFNTILMVVFLRQTVENYLFQAGTLIKIGRFWAKKKMGRALCSAYCCKIQTQILSNESQLFKDI